MIDRILDLMNTHKVNAKQLTTKLEISNSAITDWKKGKAKPGSGQQHGGMAVYSRAAG